MIVRITTNQQQGDSEYVGHVLTRGPSRIVMILTEPYNHAGSSVSLPINEVVSEERLEELAAS
jgi:hypothetical protein